GLIAYFFLVPTVAGLVGLAPAGHGHGEADEANGSAAALWAVRGVVSLAGFVVGWFLYKPVNKACLVFFGGFNAVFNRLTNGYGRIVRGVLRISTIMLLVYGGLIAMTVLGFKIVPGGFIPQQDKGYLVVNAQLPEGASLERTDEIVARMTEIAR